MANTLGQTRVEAFDALSDQQLFKQVEYAGRFNRPDAFAELYTYAKDNRPAVFSRISAAAELGAPIEQVDVTSGLNAKMRAALSFIPTADERIAVMQRMVGEKSEVKAVDAGQGNPELFYRNPEFNNGYWTKVDESGFSVNDFADLLGEAPRTGAAIGAAVATAPLSPKVQAASAGLASTMTGMAQDAVIRWATGQDVQAGEIAKRRGMQGVVETTIDYATLKAAGPLSRLVRSGRTATPADVAEATQRLHKAYNELDARFNTQLDRTAGVRSGEVKIGKDLAERESIIAGSVPDGMLARRLSHVRDQIGDMMRALRGESKVTFPEAYAALRNRVMADYRFFLNEATEASAKTKNYIKSSITKRLEGLGYEPGMSISDAGAKLRKSLIDVREAKTRINQQRWTDVDRQMDADGVVFKAQSVADRLNKLVRGSTLPKDEKGDVLSEFLTPQIREIGRQASGLENPTAMEIMDAFVKRGGAGGTSKPAPLSYATMREWRSRIGQRIDWNDRTVKTRDMRKLWSALDDMIKEGEKAAKPATKKSLEKANQYFKDNVLPFREGKLSKVLDAPVQDFRVGDEDVLGSLLNLTEVRRIKSQLGNNSDAIKGLRQAYIEKITGKASNTYDGRLNLYDLASPSIDRELAKELFGANGTRAIYELGQLAKLKALGDGTATLKPETVTRLFEARTPADVRRIARAARAEMQAHEKLKKFQSQAMIKDLVDGNLAAPDAPILVDAMMSSGATPKQVRTILNKVGKEEQAAIRQEFFGRLLNQADMGASKSTRMSVRREKGMLWDTDKMTKMLKDPKQRRVIETVLGKEDAKVLENLNLALHSVRSDFDKGVSMLSGRPIVSAGKDGPPSMVFIATELPRAVWHRTLSAMYGGGLLNKVGWTRLLSDTKEARKFFRDTLPITIGSERGIQALGEEGNKDPRFQAWIQDFLAKEGEQAPAQ